jgi:hypothetical protein
MQAQLLGSFDSPIDDAARTKVFETLLPLASFSNREGLCFIQVAEAEVVKVSIDVRALSALRLAKRILEGVVDENRKSLVEDAGRSRQSAVTLAAWGALDAVRSDGYRHGAYEVELESGAVISTNIGRWDAAILEQVDELVYDIYKANWWVYNALLEEPEQSFELRISFQPIVERAA